MLQMVNSITLWHIGQHAPKWQGHITQMMPVTVTSVAFGRCRGFG